LSKAAQTRMVQCFAAVLWAVGTKSGEQLMTAHKPPTDYFKYASERKNAAHDES